MSDLIEQAAIDKWKNDFRDYVNALDLPRDDYKGIMEYIDELPSAEPGPSTEIQEILDYLDNTLHPIVSPDNWNVYAELHDMVSKLPPAQPERLMWNRKIKKASIHRYGNEVRGMTKTEMLMDRMTGAGRMKNGQMEQRRAMKDLPSAQPEHIRINLNEPIKVKLTDWGKEIYYHQYDRVNRIAGREICKPKFPKEDENGYTEFQLWCFIELYGEHMGMTLPNVIEPLEIVYGR